MLHVSKEHGCLAHAWEKLPVQGPGATCPSGFQRGGRAGLRAVGGWHTPGLAQAPRLLGLLSAAGVRLPCLSALQLTDQRCFLWGVGWGGQNIVPSQRLLSLRTGTKRLRSLPTELRAADAPPPAAAENPAGRCGQQGRAQLCPEELQPAPLPSTGGSGQNPF